MATVNPNSLRMTDLEGVSAGAEDVEDGAHVGTAGAMLDFLEAIGLFAS